jgi:hypothetical protein
MATYSKKMMGKEVGDGAVYAPPHTMTGKSVTASTNPGSGPDQSDASSVNMSVGNINRRSFPEAKTTGIVTRGNGAATKGRIARGPMA